MEHKEITIQGKTYQECTKERYDSLGENHREFIDFGNGFTYARRKSYIKGRDIWAT